MPHGLWKPRGIQQAKRNRLERTHTQTESPLPADAGADAAAGLELAVAEADAGVADHAGVEGEHAADGLLGGGRGVEPHREVVPVVVPHLVHRHRPRQREHPPVRHAPYHPLVLQHQLPGRDHDPVFWAPRQLFSFVSPSLSR